MERFPLDPSLGALQIGFTISTFLFGITTVQVYLYYQQFSDDSRKTKALVTIVWLLELAHQISLSQGIYDQTIKYSGQPKKLLKLSIGSATCFLFEGGVALLAQCFFAHRVWIVTEKIALPALASTMAGLRFVTGILLAIEAYNMVAIEVFEVQWEWLITFILVDGACIDVIIAASLCHNLIQHRRSASIRTVKLLDRLILCIIQTGLVTSLVAVSMTICFLTMKGNLIWLAMYFFHPRLFSNSLLASLHARANLRKMGGFSTPEPSHRSATGSLQQNHGLEFRTAHIPSNSDASATADAGGSVEAWRDRDRQTQV